MTALRREEDQFEALGGARWVLWTAFLAMTVLGTWAYFAQIDQIVRAQGEVVPSLSVQSVQTEFGGVLSEILVAEGDVVDQGQILVRLDTTLAEAEYSDAMARLNSSRARLERLLIETLEQDRPVAPHVELQEGLGRSFYETQNALFEKRTAALQEEIASLDQILKLVQEEIAINLPLAELGDVSQTEILRLKREEAELIAKKVSIRNRYLEEAQSEYAEVEEEVERLLLLAVQKKRVVEQAYMVAPRRGIVTNMQSVTLGRVFRPGDLIMEIVPVGDDLLIEAKVATLDIGFIDENQEAVIKIDAYDYTIYGDLKGQVTYISADAEEEESPQGTQRFYSVRVRTSGKRFSKSEEELRVIPGMTVMAEIKTGQSTVLEYLLKPIIKTLDSALAER